jgi:transcriptional regulator with XRE-family HTH domain
MQLVELRLGRSIEEILRERIDAGKTQREIEDELGLGAGVVSRWLERLGMTSKPSEAVA